MQRSCPLPAVVYFANTLIFIVVGIQTRWALSTLTSVYSGLGKMLLLFLALNVSRCVASPYRNLGDFRRGVHW